MAPVTKRPNSRNINGILITRGFSPKCFKEAMAYDPNPGDTFIVTFPKCGTTWMQHIVLYIYRKGQALDNPLNFTKFCTYVDMYGVGSIDNMPRPGTIKTHFPFSHVNYSREAKYIYVSRNPKDCCVSFYYHTRSMPLYSYWYGQFDDYVELFLEDELEYNGYFNHVMSWYPRLKDRNVLFTTYEDMSRDLKGVVVKVANFLGKEHAETVEKDNNALNNILHRCSFEALKKDLPRLYDLLHTSQTKDPPASLLPEGVKYALDYLKSLDIPDDCPPLNFFRKGIVGDWKNHFTAEQSDRFDKQFLEKTKGTDIPSWFVAK